MPQANGFRGVVTTGSPSPSGTANVAQASHTATSPTWKRGWQTSRSPKRDFVQQGASASIFYRAWV